MSYRRSAGDPLLMEWANLPVGTAQFYNRSLSFVVPVKHGGF